ncbi:archease [Maribacter aestuarii]|uniref:archease n=1 Tax=Maribacter aestuarii TaxID=1130723 RepID=UPI00248C389E|nr:archease [Maribacter aestuarii]
MHLEVEKSKKHKRRPIKKALETPRSQITVEGLSLQHLFKNSLRGLGHLLSPGACSSAKHYDCTMKIQVTAENSKDLLLNFLTEILALTHKHHTIFCTMYAEEITESKIVAQVYGTWFKNFDMKIKSIAKSKCYINRKEDFSYTGTIVFELGDMITPIPTS